MLRFNLRCLTSVCFLAGFVLSPAAANQPEPRGETQDGGAIIVTGTRASPNEIHRMAEEFVHRAGIARGTQPAARWVEPICPQVVGLNAPYDYIVKTRLHAAAAKAELKIGKPSCHPNVTVIFVEDAGSFVRTLAARSAQSMRGLEAPERRALLTGNAPIRWFYTTEARGGDGDRPMAGTPPGLEISGSAGGLPSAGAMTLRGRGSSIIRTQTMRALLSAMVVVDIKGVEGLPLTSVADYAALVGFAELRPSDPPPNDSILSLFAEEGGSRTLTDWDLTLLRTLYKMPIDREARRHRGLLVRGLVAKK